MRRLKRMSRSWRRLFKETRTLLNPPRTLLNPPCLGGTFLFYSHTDPVDRTDLFATDFYKDSHVVRRNYSKLTMCQKPRLVASLKGKTVLLHSSKLGSVSLSYPCRWSFASPVFCHISKNYSNPTDFPMSSQGNIQACCLHSSALSLHPSSIFHLTSSFFLLPSVILHYFLDICCLGMAVITFGV